MGGGGDSYDGESETERKNEKIDKINCYARRGVYVSNLSFVPIVSYFIDEPISLRNENNRLITSQAKTLVSIVRYKVRNMRFLSFRIILGIAV